MSCCTTASANTIPLTKGRSAAPATPVNTSRSRLGSLASSVCGSCSAHLAPSAPGRLTCTWSFHDPLWSNLHGCCCSDSSDSSDLSRSPPAWRPAGPGRVASWFREARATVTATLHLPPHCVRIEAVNAGESVHSLARMRALASTVTLVRRQFRRTGQSQPLAGDPQTRQWTETESLDLSFHFPAGVHGLVPQFADNCASARTVVTTAALAGVLMRGMTYDGNAGVLPRLVNGYRKVLTCPSSSR